jgi:hypothetical protein
MMAKNSDLRGGGVVVIYDPAMRMISIFDSRDLEPQNPWPGFELEPTPKDTLPPLNPRREYYNRERNGHGS